MINNKFYVSTGTFVGRNNNYNYKLIPAVRDSFDFDGFEFLIMPSFYECEEEILSFLKENKIICPSFHTDKFIGKHLEEGNYDEAHRLFKDNLNFAKRLECEKMVLHLWFGDVNKDNMDKLFEYEMLFEKECGNDILLTIENIPCMNYDPLSLWLKLMKYNKNVKFTFDTRFATFYNQYIDIFASEAWNNVRHVHISSYTGHVEEGKRLIRPILHPGEGVPDFVHLISNMPHYDGTITLESPVIDESGNINPKKLEKSISYLKELFEKYN